MSATADLQFSMFWELPAEIRLQIYRELLLAPVEPPNCLRVKVGMYIVARHQYPTVRQPSDSANASSPDVWIDSPWWREKDEDYCTSQCHMLPHPYCERAWSMLMKSPTLYQNNAFRDKRPDFMLASRRLYQEAMVQYHQEVALEVGLPEELVDLMLRTHACGTSHLVRSLFISFNFFDDYAEYITLDITLFYPDLSDWIECLDALKPGAVAQAFPQLRTLTLTFAPHPTHGVYIDRESEDFKPFVTDTLAPKLCGLSQVEIDVKGLHSAGPWVEATLRGIQELPSKDGAHD